MAGLFLCIGGGRKVSSRENFRKEEKEMKNGYFSLFLKKGNFASHISGAGAYITFGGCLNKRKGEKAEVGVIRQKKDLSRTHAPRKKEELR